MFREEIDSLRSLFQIIYFSPVFITLAFLCFDIILNARIDELQTEINSERNKSVSTDEFMAIVRKYTRARKLTPRMLNELIEKIEVHQSEKIDGKTVQRLTIHYNCIGVIDMPNLEKLPENNVSVHTRQGVDIHFAACAS